MGMARVRDCHVNDMDVMHASCALCRPRSSEAQHDVMTIFASPCATPTM